MYFARMARSLPAIRTPKCKSSEKYGLCGKRSLKRWSAALLNPACAYGGLLSGTVHVLRFLQGFVPSPGYHVHPPRLSMISGASFFLVLTLHRLATSVDLTTIYHNIRCPHLLRRPQCVSTHSASKEHVLPPGKRSETL